MTKKIRVSYDDVTNAWCNWTIIEKNDDDYLTTARTEFWKFLGGQVFSTTEGYDVTTDSSPLHYKMTPEAAHKVQMLLGPHHQTIKKAWLIKRKWHTYQG